MSDPRMSIPGGTPPTASLAGPEVGRTYHPLDEADYYTYGQKGPEHQFFTGNLPVAPLKPGNLPNGTGGGPTGADVSGAAGILGGLTGVAQGIKAGNQINDLYKKGSDLFSGSNSALNAVGSGSYADQAVAGANLAPAVIDPALSSGELGANSFADFSPSASSAIDAAAADAAGQAGWHGVTSGTLANGVGLNDLGGLIGAGYTLAKPQGKFGGTISGAASGMQLAGWPGAIVGAALGYARNGGIPDANPWDASGFSGTTMDKAWKDQNIARLASNPAASVASAAGIKSDSVLGKILDPSGLFSKHGDEKRNMKAFLNENTVSDAGNGMYSLNGKTLNKDQLQDLAGAWYGATYHPDGKQDYWKDLYSQKLSQYGLGKARGGSLETGVPGILHHATQDPKFNGPVRGRGTGRSDEIPARLSDGEYVMDAETVSMLGDGSTDAGAKKLDQMREKLRSHKGKTLARGKFSPNAKDPMEYLS